MPPTRDRGSWRRHIRVLDYWCLLKLPFGVPAILLLSFPLLLVFFCFLFCSCFYLFFIYRLCIYLSRVVMSLYHSRAGGLLWPRSLLWVWVAVVLPSPEIADSFSMSEIHWVGWWWWYFYKAALINIFPRKGFAYTKKWRCGFN